MNKLSLPTQEFENLYTKHLLLKKLLNNDVSLYILSICFLRRKSIALTLYNHDSLKAWSLLIALEDRFINGVLAYKIGYASNIKYNEFFYYSYDLLNKSKLDSEESFYLAMIYDNGYGKTSRDDKKARQLYKLSAKQWNVHAMVNIGHHYRLLGKYDKAKEYLEKAVLLNLPLLNVILDIS